MFRSMARRCASGAARRAPDHPAACVDGVWAESATLSRVDIHGVATGVKAGGGTTVTDSWVHDLGPTPVDAVRTQGARQEVAEASRRALAAPRPDPSEITRHVVDLPVIPDAAETDDGAGEVVAPRHRLADEAAHVVRRAAHRPARRSGRAFL